MKLVKEARREEVGFMKQRHLWTMKPLSECYEKTGGLQ